MNPVIITITLMYALSLFVLTITFWVIWYRNRIKLSPYKPYGYAMGLILIGFEVATLLLLITGDTKLSIPVIIFTDIIAFLRIVAFTLVGIHFCKSMGLVSFPFLMEKFGTPKVEIAETSHCDTEIPLEENALLETETVNLDTIEHSGNIQENILPRPGLRNMILSSSAVAFAGIVFSVLLFWMTKPSISDIIMTRFAIDPSNNIQTPTLLTILIVLVFAFAEEIIFRLGIQNFFAKCFRWQSHKYWLAIILTTSIWTLGHVGMMEPNWVKLVQIFPFGIALGWLFRKYGTESCIIAHSIFNLILLIPSEHLIY